MKSLLVFCVLFGSSVVQSYAAVDKLFCYYGSWATYRQGNGKFEPEDIDPFLCTHVIYTFVGLSQNGELKLLDSWNDIDKKALKRMVDLKQANSNLKVMVAMGGWNEGSQVYSTVAANDNLRTTMVKSVVEFCKKYNFDGFDLDWEYPGMRGGSPADKANYIELLKDLRIRFDKENLILTAAVGISQQHIDSAYDIAGLSKYVNFIQFMSYDLRGPWDQVTGINSPLYPSSKEQSQFAELNINSAIKSWINHGADPNKIILGIPLYGHSYTLANEGNTNVGAPISGPGQAGQYTNQGGFLMYSELCEAFQQGGWTFVWDEEQKVPYAFKGNQWAGYDDVQSVKLKVDFAKENGLGGVMVWSIESDDARGVCGGGKFPLITAIRAGISVPSSGVDPPPNPVITQKSAPSPIATVKPPTPGGSICTAEGYVRDPSDCSVFYWCQASSGSFVQNKFNCPSGLAYNNKQFYCDWPANVQC